MKNLIYGGLLLVIGGVVGCNKDRINNPAQVNIDDAHVSNENSEISEYRYFMNGVRQDVAFDALVSNNKNNYLHGTIVYDSVLDNCILEMHCFTNKQLWLAYGKQHNIGFNNILRFENEIDEYLNKNPMVEELWESKGVLDEDFEILMDDLYKKCFGAVVKAPTVIWDKWFGGSSWTAFTPTQAVMPLGWNNRVSAFQRISIVTTPTVFYQKTFFRNRMFTFSNPFHGFQRIDFSGPLIGLDNQTSSMIH
jgi:hypothetical protein